MNASCFLWTRLKSEHSFLVEKKNFGFGGEVAMKRSKKALLACIALRSRDLARHSRHSGIGCIGTMDPLIPNRLALPGLAGLAYSCKVWWLEIDLALPKGLISLSPAREASPRSRVPNLALVTCYLSSLHSQVKGQSHALVCGSQSHTLIPTSARSRPTALPKPIIISVPRPHCWKDSASKPYVELPPHTAPLGMEVGQAQAFRLRSFRKSSRKEFSSLSCSWSDRQNTTICSTQVNGSLLTCTPSKLLPTSWSRLLFGGHIGIPFLTRISEYGFQSPPDRSN
ncbi:hypothetical protein E6C27_scaffold404G001030 [Cucumis melo var. makuwa]|uniref:Uncharacterized protein n=1 Tax=Cucumis melo var. makuwa TaxID=1194695 RepID=A0A5A7U8W9_CUCMM|nr:hypothetical protein E6C27_scaffold404G001030 [Cucumis melo var. makuwa]